GKADIKHAAPETQRAPAGARSSKRGTASGPGLGLALDLALDGLAGDLRRRAFGRLFAALAHAVLESAHRAAQIRADVAQLLRTEDQHHDHQDDQPVPDAERTHRASCISLFPPRQHRAQWLGPAEDVHMYMIHLLMSDPPGVQDDPEAIGRALLPGELSRERKHLAERLVLSHPGFVQRRDVLLRDDEQVHRCLRADVVEREHIFVLVDPLRRNLAAGDLAEDAAWIAAHFARSFLLCLRAAFSSMPEIPSRRCNSASTSAGPRPCRARRIMQWNHRSAVSRTSSRRSPDLAARITSVASSPTFLRTASSLSTRRRAT